MSLSLRNWIGKKFSLRDTGAWSAIAGGESWSGEPVTVDRALQLSAFWACVRLIAQTVASLPLQVFEKNAAGEKIARNDHPIYDLLHDSPNADQTAAEFWETICFGILTQGNAYAEKVYSGPRLVSLNPIAASPYRKTPGADLRYRFSDRGKTEDLPEDRIFHVKGFGAGGDLGMSPVGFARQTLGVAIAVEKATGGTFANGIKPSGFFVMPGELTPEQREQARKVLVDPYKGAGNAWRVGILEAGVKFEPVTINPHDAEMLLSRKFNTEEICRWFGVPPVLIGHAADGQTMWGSGVEQLILGWLTLGLRPYLTRIEQSIKKRIIAPEERRTIVAEFNLDGLLRGDSKSRAEFLSKMTQNGLMTRNEGRAKENLPALAGGDVLTVQSNLLPIDKLGTFPPTPTPEPRSPHLNE